MLVVIEGVDGSGKTTFARTLMDLAKQRTPLVETRLLHYGPPKRDPLEEYELDVEWYRPGSGAHVVADRFHWGELIYGPLYRGTSRLSVAGARHVELFLKARGGLLVHLSPPEADVRRAMTKNREDFLQSEHVTDVISAYYDRMPDALVDVMHFSLYPDKFDAEDVLRLAMHLEDKAKPVAEFKTFVGHPRCDLLLLGERRNHPTEQRHEAAFVPYSETSGKYLLDALPLGMLRQIGIANACEENVHDLWMATGRPTVVALGNAAHKLCVESELPLCGSVPHPQYVRRFHHDKALRYVELIVEAASTGRDLRRAL